MDYSKRTRDVLKHLTIKEKAALLSGKTVWESLDIPRLNIPSLVCSDGPSGLRRQVGEGDHLGLNASVPATCFPSAATIANSWNIEIAREVGSALGEEAAALGVDVLLGPGLNIKRSPLCGRNFEYFSEDPYLAGKMAAAYIDGIQSQGVAACPKHFAVNSQEERRMAMNAVLDERTLREIYLTGFEIAVKEGHPYSIMSSYNEINGIYANENPHLLQEILREEWGFDGIVITDWGASNDHTAGVAAGSNLEMPAPGYDSARKLISDLENGKITQEEIDTCVGDLLEINFRIQNMKKYAAREKKNRIPEELLNRHHSLARTAAAESIVLLKNEENLLPLDDSVKVLLVGDFAKEPRYQGSGSSNVNSARVDKVSELLIGDVLSSDYHLKCIGQADGYLRNSGRDAKLEQVAMEMAEDADVILYFFGLDDISESEGLDRTHMRIPENQIVLLEKMSTLNKPIVGILSGGAPIEMPWEKHCKAILNGYLNGQAGARAILDVLSGVVNPSGKLNESYPLRYEDTPAYHYYPAKSRDSQYRESIYVGYRYYDTVKTTVRYPFGYGLSYTEFQYSDLRTDRQKVSFTLTNTGHMGGAEIAQLYVGLPGGRVFRPAKELKGFCKVFLAAGQSMRVEIPLDERTFRYWDVKSDRWETEGGTWQIMIGSSSADIRLTGTLEVEGSTGQISPYDIWKLPSYQSGKIQEVSDREYERFLNGQVPQEKTQTELTINDAICQMGHAKNGLARMVFRILNGMKEKSEKKGKPDLNILFIYNMPFRAMAKMTGGMISMEMVEGIVAVVNGHFFRGIGSVIGGFFRNKKANKEFARSLEALPVDVGAAQGKGES